MLDRETSGAAPGEMGKTTPGFVGCGWRLVLSSQAPLIRTGPQELAFPGKWKAGGLRGETGLLRGRGKMGLLKGQALHQRFRTVTSLSSVASLQGQPRPTSAGTPGALYHFPVVGL